MPKSFSEQEREYIKKRLKEEATKCLAQYGVRHTTVNELVKRVNIPKGTFYLFYESKEMLLFDALQEQHEFVTQELNKAVSDLAKQEVTVEKLTEVIFKFYKMADDLPILKLLNSDELELLTRKLPQEVVMEHFQDDTDNISKIFAKLSIKKDIDVELISSVFHAIYFATLHKVEIGVKQYDQVLYTLIYGIVIQLL